MMNAQRQLSHNANIRYNNTEVSTQQLVRHYVSNLFYFQQFFPLATLQTPNGPKKFIDLADKNAKCTGINANVNGSWELETQIVRLNPKCHMFGFGSSDNSRQLVEAGKNSVFEQAILTYDERIPLVDDLNHRQIPFFNFLEREFGTASIDFLHSDDPLNGINLLRFIFENQHVVDPICQLNIPIRRNNKPEEFSKEMKKLFEDLAQSSYFIMHVDETVPDEQWNFFLINLFYEECTQKFFSDPLY